MRGFLSILCLFPLLSGPAAHADGDDPVQGEVSVQLFKTNALGTDASGGLTELEFGTIGFDQKGNSFFGITRQRGFIPLLQSNIEIGTGFEDQETTAYGLNSSFGIYSKSHFKWKDGSGIQRSGSDVGVGAFLQLDSYDIRNAFEDFYLAIAVRTNSLIGHTSYPGSGDDGLSGVVDLDVGAAIPISETAIVHLKYEQVRSWLGAQDNRVFEQALTATLTHHSVDFSAKIQSWEFKGKSGKGLRLGVQFNGLLDILIPKIFPTSDEKTREKKR